MNLNSATDEFLKFCAVERQLSPLTIEAYTADLRDFHRFVSIESPPRDLSAETLVLYLRHLVARGLASTSIRRRFACLRVFFKRMAKQTCCDDPCLGFELNLARRKRLPRTLSRSEASLLAKPSTKKSLEEEATDLAVCIRLMISTGIRVGELCKVRPDDVSPDGSSIRILGKGARDRIVYIADGALQRDLSELSERSGRQKKSTTLLRNRFGAPMSPQSIRARLRRLADRLGIVRRVTPHMLRHTAATLLIEEGVDIRFVQRLLGHSTIATTEIYTHVADKALKMRLQQADVLGNLN